MNKSDPIFVAGHRGLVGAAIVRRLEADGFDTVDPAIADVVDELRKLFRYEGYRLGSTSVLTAGMGPEERWEMINTVRRLWETQDMTLIFIEHDMGIVFEVAQTINVLKYGAVLASGPPDAIRGNPDVIEAYLGGARHVA